MTLATVRCASKVTRVTLLSVTSVQNGTVRHVPVLQPHNLEIFKTRSTFVKCASDNFNFNLRMLDK